MRVASSPWCRPIGYPNLTWAIGPTLHMYVCMSICMYVCMCIVYVRMYVCMYDCMMYMCFRASITITITTCFNCLQKTQKQSAVNLRSVCMSVCVCLSISCFLHADIRPVLY